jgi:site-specific recombinase XerD
MSAEPSVERQASIRSAVTRSVLCAGYGVRTPAKPMCSFRSVAARSIHHLIQRLGKAAEMPFAVHPHMLRHACGFKLANDGHDTRALQHYLGHKNIQHTVRYTELGPDRFKDFWR